MSRQILSFRIQVWHPHTRTCVWTPWSVFQDGSYDALQANVLGRSGNSETPSRSAPSTLGYSPFPARRRREKSRPVQRWARGHRWGPVPEGTGDPGSPPRTHPCRHFTGDAGHTTGCSNAATQRDRRVTPQITGAQPIPRNRAGFIRLRYSDLRHV